MAPTSQAEQGRYIVIEGPPGSGKSLHIELLARRLRASGYRVQVFNGLSNEPVDDQDAIAAARAQGFICLARGNYLSSLVKQYYGDKTAADYAQLSASLSTTAKPADLTIVLDSPGTTLKERLKKRQNVTADLSYLERIRTGYLWEAKQRSFPVIYTSGEPEQAQAAIWELIGGKADAPAVAAKPANSQPTPIGAVIKERLQPKPAAAPPAGGPAQAAPVNPPPLPPKNQTLPNFLLQLNGLSYLAASELKARIGSRHINSTTPPYNPNAAAFYSPGSLTPQLAKSYAETMRQIFTLHSQIVAGLAAHISKSSPLAKQQQDADFLATVQAQAIREAAAVLPIASLLDCTVAISAGTPRAIGRQFKNADVPELQRVAAQLPPVFAYNAEEEPEQPGLAILREMADQALPQHSGSLDEDLRLMHYGPRNELTLLPHMLYATSDASLTSIQSALDGLTYNQKSAAFLAYAGLDPQTIAPEHDVLTETHYTWDILSDAATFFYCEAIFPNAHLTRQRLTPRYGFDMPEQIEAAGLDAVYEQCFDLSAELYSSLQTAGLSNEAQYATLLGHRTRWKLSHTARDAYALYKASAPTDTTAGRKLLKQLQEKLAEIHPLLNDAMQSFGEDNSQ